MWLGQTEIVQNRSLINSLLSNLTSPPLPIKILTSRMFNIPILDFKMCKTIHTQRITTSIKDRLVKNKSQK